VIAKEWGRLPTGMVAVTVLVAVLVTAAALALNRRDA
jgi:hypothetical protein